MIHIDELYVSHTDIFEIKRRTNYLFVHYQNLVAFSVMFTATIGEIGAVMTTVNLSKSGRGEREICESDKRIGKKKFRPNFIGT